MKATLSPTSVADFCQDLVANKITVNRDYQRDDRIWSPYIRSYFIESILLEYPIPKIFLYVRYNLKTRTSTKEIVDGQQRSQALRLFYENKMRISTKIETQELRGKRYRDLDETLQGRFLSYSLAIDEFTGVSEDEIRESFARMNVHNVTLNSEELRNAKFQGPFKMFIFRMARAFREVLFDAGVISRRDVIRMADTRLMSDIVYILDRGFTTTRPPEIDAIYKDYNASFAKEDDYEEYLKEAFGYWHQNSLANYPRLASKHVFYTLIAAICELLHPGLVTSTLDDDHKTELEDILAMGNSLSALNDKLSASANEEGEIGEEDGEAADEASLDAFVSACTEKTNVGRQKFIRFAYFLSALKEA